MGVKEGFFKVWNALIPDRFFSREGAGALLGGCSYVLTVEVAKMLVISLVR